jgi:hypothetical protein
MITSSTVRSVDRVVRISMPRSEPNESLLKNVYIKHICTVNHLVATTQGILL